MHLMLWRESGQQRHLDSFNFAKIQFIKIGTKQEENVRALFNE
jgi:hypothetical protein